MGVVLVKRGWQRRWRLVGLLILSLIVVPMSYKQLTLVQVTTLQTKPVPVLVIQDRGKVILINSGDPQTVKYSVIPFLAQQGINQIDYGVTFSFSPKPILEEGWSKLQENVSIKILKGNQESLSLGEPLSLGTTKVELISIVPPILQLTIAGQNWLWAAGKLNSQQLKVKPQVLLWNGKPLEQEWLDKIQLKGAIALSRNLDPNTEQQLQQRKVALYWTKRDGAIQWTPQQGFQKILPERNDLAIGFDL
jgi:competence protein ComEC